MEQINKTIEPEILFSAVKEQLALGREASFTVTGRSMWPFLCHGRDHVIVESCRPEDLRIGDIILFQTPYKNYMLHRITALKSGFFETTGDGNTFRDGWFSRDCALARVVCFFRKGKQVRRDDAWWRFLSSAWNLLFPLRGFLLYCLKRIGWIKAGVQRWIKSY